MDVARMLREAEETILEEACDTLGRSHVTHYEAAGDTFTRQGLRDLFRLVVDAIKDRDLAEMSVFAEQVARRRFDWAGFVRMLTDTATTTGMIFVMVIGASVFNYFMTVSEFPQQLVQAIEATNLPPVSVIALILVVYIVLGAVFDEVATMLITLPFVLPLILAWGYDPVWWGIINVTVIMIGLFCPPIGLNVFVVASLARDVPVTRIYRGVLPFVAADAIRLAICVAFPALSLYLVRLLN